MINLVNQFGKIHQGAASDPPRSEFIFPRDPDDRLLRLDQATRLSATCVAQLILPLNFTQTPETHLLVLGWNSKTAQMCGATPTIIGTTALVAKICPH